MTDISFVKFQIPLSIKRALKKGRIDKAYEQMYFVADRLAAYETQTYAAIKPHELLDEEIRESRRLPAESTEDGWATRTMKEVHTYRMERLDYHMANMLKLLEMELQARQVGQQPVE